MATTPAINIQKVPSQTPQSQEATKDAPVYQDPYAQFLQTYGKAIIDGQRTIRETWSYKRRGIVANVIKHKEFDKGNHFTGNDDDSGQSFDAFQEYANFTGQSSQEDDRSLRRHYSNFYTMLLDALQAVLSSDIPKSRFMPADAEELPDRQTAKAGSKIETIIERINKIAVMVRQEVRMLGTSGSYFKHTRYVVDADRTGTHRETTLRMSMEQVVPARFLCANCGAATPEDEIASTGQLSCPECGSPLDQRNFVEGHTEEIPVAEEKDDVPNGMVLQDVWDALHVDADPDSPNLLNTRLLNKSVEVPLGWLRMTFPEHYDDFQQGQSSGSANEQLERQYRSRLSDPVLYRGWAGYSTPDKLTYSQCWLQPMAYAELSDKALAEALKKTFPKGLVISYCGDLPLQIRPAKLTDEWTWCGAKQDNGLFPPPLMEPGISPQERINDLANIIHDWMDRMAAGIILANEKYINTKAMNGKQMLPGILNPIATKEGTPMGVGIEQMIYQVQTKLEATIFQYAESLKRDMEMLVGAPPQIFGGQGDPHVETKGGQEQQLSTAMGKLGLPWNCMRTEHAEASENAVKCAGQNMTEDWKEVVTDESEEFRNEYVRLDEMKGSVRAIPETDQGFPMTYAEIKDFFMNLLESGNEMLLDWLIQEPDNVDMMMRYVAPPGMVAPGSAMKDKALAVLGELAKSRPVVIPMPDPETGEPVPVPMPSAMPYRLDDLAKYPAMIELWAQKHWDQLKDNKDGMDNLVLFYQACIQMNKEKQAELAMPVPGAMPPNGQSQPQGAMA